MIRRRFASVAVGVVALVSLATSQAYAQGIIRGKVRDQWKNPISNVTVTASPSTRTDFGGLRGDGSDQKPREFITDNNGEFFTRGLRPGSYWVFECEAEGYETTSREELVPRSFEPLDVDFILAAAPPGERFGGTRIYEAEGGTPTFSFQEDGIFSFKDVDGEGAGTYGIVERTVILVVRTYDGPDDKHQLAVPIEVPFYSSVFPSFTWGEAKLSVK